MVKKIRKASKKAQHPEKDTELPEEITLVEEGDELDSLYSLFGVGEDTDIGAVMDGRVESEEW